MEQVAGRHHRRMGADQDASRRQARGLDPGDGGHPVGGGRVRRQEDSRGRGRDGLQGVAEAFPRATEEGDLHVVEGGRIEVLDEGGASGELRQTPHVFAAGRKQPQLLPQVPALLQPFLKLLADQGRGVDQGQYAHGRSFIYSA